jgi:hypothetical protein
MESAKVLALFLALSLGGIAGKRPPEQPLWSLQLHEVNPREIELRNLSVGFLSNDQLAVSFADHSCGKLTIIMISPGSAPKKKRLTWPCADSDAQIVPLLNGEAIVFTGNELIRISAAQEQLQSARVARSKLTQLYLSPNRKLLLLRQFVKGGEFRQTVFETSNLDQSRELHWNGRDSQGISDSGEVLVLRPNKSTSIKLSQTVSLCKFENDCTPVYPDATMRATLVSRDSVLVEIGVHKWILVRRNGTIARTYNLEPSTVIGRAASASDRFAFIAGHITSKWVSEVHVGRIDDGVEIGKVEFQQPIVGLASRSPAISVSISPDGSKFAVLRDSLLEVYPLN